MQKSIMNQVRVVILLSLIVISADGSRFWHNSWAGGVNLRPSLVSKLELKDAPRNFTRWFNQSLDHFDNGNLATWQQRYYVNDEFFDQEKRDVVFLLIGDDSEIDIDWMTHGAWINYVNKSNALMFYLEHRFYGESHPTKDLSVENLRYLTSEQALGDIATFIDAMNDEHKLSKGVKWIATGCSYGGSLAAWGRLKYPHLIHGAVSNSAPVIAVPNFQDYLGVVADDLRNSSEECYNAVQAGTAQILPLLQNQVGQRALTSLFKLCSPLEESIENKDDISIFFGNLASNFGIIAQYNNILDIGENSTGFLNVDLLCSIMTNTSIKQEVDRLAEVNSLVKRSFNQSCSSFKYKSIIEGLRNVSWEAANGDRQFKFQTCNEIGSYQTTDKKPQIFGDKLPFEFYIKQCTDVFGSKFNSQYLDYATRRTNTIYGGYDIEVSNVVFVHGSADPWSALGITSTRNKYSPAIFIHGTGHCANVFSEDEDDLPQLKAARAQIGDLIQSWLKSS